MLGRIDIKDISRIFYRYKYMIFSLVILFGMASSYYAYFQPDEYEATATVEVGMEKRGSSRDVLSVATSPGIMNAATEMEIIRSRKLSGRILKKVDFAHRYYTTKRFKEVELYKDSPFQVAMNKGFDISFDLHPVNAEHYRLVVTDAKDENETVWEYDEILPYDKEIVTEHFHLNIIKSSAVQEVKYRFVVMNPEDIRGIVQERVSVSQPSEYATILEISYTDNIALRAQEAANALAEAYLKQNIEKKTKEESLRLDYIDKQLDRITENLKSSAIKLEEFKRSANTVNLSAKAENIIRHMGESEAKLEEMSIQEGMLKKLYKQVKSGKKLETISTVSAGKDGATLSHMIKQLQDAIINKRILRENYTALYPEVRKLTKMISQLKKLIVSTIKNLSENIEDRKKLLSQSIAQQQKILNKLPADERMFGQLQSKFAVNEKIYSSLLEKRSQTAIIKASTVSKNRVIDLAILPKEPIKPERELIVLLGLVLGLIMGIVLAFLRAFLNNRIKSEEDIIEGTDVPVIGTVPHMGRDKDRIKVFLSPKSSVAEAYRNIRTNLQFMQIKGKPHVIALTSTVGGEGKTSCCINLGGIMSMSDKKTIILSLDMRKPTMHEKFGLQNKVGMSNLLSGAASLSDVIQHTEYDNLDIVASGPIPPNPNELIQSEFMLKVIEKLKEIYDVIIIDTPPIGLVADARILMHYADTSIYVLRADYSEKAYFRSVNNLAKEEIGSFTILLNDVKSTHGGYGYGGGDGYGYYEEEEK